MRFWDLLGVKFDCNNSSYFLLSLSYKFCIATSLNYIRPLFVKCSRIIISVTAFKTNFIAAVSVAHVL